MYVELNFSRESGARKTYSVLGRHKKDSYVMAARKEQVSSFRFGMSDINAWIDNKTGKDIPNV